MLMHSLFDDMFAMLEPATAPVPARASFSTPASVNTTDTGYEITVVAPGIPRDEIDVEVTGRQLRISYDAREDTKSRIRHRAFSRTWRVPEDADLEQIGADYTDGVLTVTVPKLASVCQTRKIAIGPPPSA